MAIIHEDTVNLGLRDAGYQRRVRCSWRETEFVDDYAGWDRVFGFFGGSRTGLATHGRVVGSAGASDWNSKSN